MARRSKNKAQANQRIVPGATYVTKSAPISDHQTTTKKEDSTNTPPPPPTTTTTTTTTTTINETTHKITTYSTTPSITSPTTSTSSTTPTSTIPSNKSEYTKVEEEEKKKDPLSAWTSQIGEEEKQLSNRKKYKLAAQLAAKEVESWANDEPVDWAVR